MVEAHRLTDLPRRTVVDHPRIVLRRRMAVAAVIAGAEHLPITVAEVGRLPRVEATAVEAAAEGLLLAAATVVIGK
jgi:hypothetical protein